MLTNEPNITILNRIKRSYELFAHAYMKKYDNDYIMIYHDNLAKSELNDVLRHQNDEVLNIFEYVGICDNSECNIFNFKHWFYNPKLDIFDILCTPKRCKDYTSNVIKVFNKNIQSHIVLKTSEFIGLNYYDNGNYAIVHEIYVYYELIRHMNNVLPHFAKCYGMIKVPPNKTRCSTIYGLNFKHKKIISDKCDVYCIVYEYIDGVSFKDYISSCSLLDFKKYLIIILQVLKEAKLKYNYTHGDLHQENIIMKPIGNNEFSPIFIDYHSNSGIINDKRIQVLYEEYTQFEDIETPIFDDVYTLIKCCALSENIIVSDYCIKLLEYFDIYTDKQDLDKYKFYNLPYCKNTCTHQDITLLKAKYDIDVPNVWNHNRKFDNFDHFIDFVNSIKID